MGPLFEKTILMITVDSQKASFIMLLNSNVPVQHRCAFLVLAVFQACVGSCRMEFWACLMCMLTFLTNNKGQATRRTAGTQVGSGALRWMVGWGC